MLELRFYESVENLRSLLKARTGKTVQYDLARRITAHLAQGRMYLVSAAAADFAIRPLILFYAMESLAGAVILTRTLNPLGFASTHGLTPSVSAEFLEGFSARITTSGVLPALNDSVKDLESCLHYDYTSDAADWKSLPCPTVDRQILKGTEITFRDALARIPGLQSLYSRTFGEPASTVQCGGIVYRDAQDGRIEIYAQSRAQDKSELKTLLADLRARFPLLDRTVLTQVRPLDTISVLTFAMADRAGMDEFLGVVATGPGAWDFGVPDDVSKLPLEAIKPPMAGSLYGGTRYLVAPLSAGQVSEVSLLYIAMFILATIVRYHPAIWYHAITSSETPIRALTTK